MDEPRLLLTWLHVVSLRDLLGENPTDKLDIKLNPDGSGQLYVPGLTTLTVQSPEDINRVRTSLNAAAVWFWNHTKPRF